MSTDECPKCEGCGKVADTKDQEPWTAWTSLPLNSSAAVLLGFIKPKTCPKCNGSGLLAEPEDNQ